MMYELTPKNVKSIKSRSVRQIDDGANKSASVPDTVKIHSHFLLASENLDKVTKKAPHAQIERKSLKEGGEKSGVYLDINRFTAFLEDTVDLNSLLFETAMVLKTVTESCGVYVYIVDKLKNQIVLMDPHTKNLELHEVNVPIEEGKTVAGHVAFTKEYLLLEDVQNDRRFAKSLKWVDAKVALGMPIVKPNGDCYAVLELYRTTGKPYGDTIVYTVVSVASWAGAAVHQAQARVILQKTSHLNNELRTILQNYFCDLASIDTMLTDMLAVLKTFIGATRSSFYIIDKDNISEFIHADMWDDGWAGEMSTMPRKKAKVNLTQEQTPAGLVARTGVKLNVIDAYKDARFSNEIDPTTGTVVRSCLVWPIVDKSGVIGVVQLTNKRNAQPFNAEDERIFSVFVSYCSLIVHFYNMQQKKIYHRNMNKAVSELMSSHLKPCKHELEEHMESSGGIVVPPVHFKSFIYHITDGSREEMPSLVYYMFTETFGDVNFERATLMEYILTVLGCYRNNAYHNAEHAFCFTHTMYMILINNMEFFNYIEIIGLMLAGLCHDIDHPGYNNNFLALCKHPLAKMYRSSMLEQHHYYITKKVIELLLPTASRYLYETYSDPLFQEKNILCRLPQSDQELILEEIKYNILCTDLAVYFETRAQLAPLLVDHQFNWNDILHRKMLKGILMTTSDLSGCCKQFGVSKAIAKAVYEEFYDQGDRERAMGYTPLSMMDRRRKINQPAEQIQFISVVVLPCLLLLQTILPNTSELTDNCRKTQDSWHAEIEIRGQSCGNKMISRKVIMKHDE